MKCQKCGLEFEGTYCPNGCNIPKQCPKCKTFYNGNFCPNGCNSSAYQKQKKKSNKKLAVILSVIVIIFAFAATMGILYGEEEQPETNNVSSEETINYIEVSANDLWRAFSDNEVLAEKTYTGKHIKVTGVVSEINSSDFIYTANVLLKVDDAMFSCVQCNFQKANTDKIAELKKGQTVTICGVCSDLDINVQVEDCKIE